MGDNQNFRLGILIVARHFAGCRLRFGNLGYREPAQRSLP